MDILYKAKDLNFIDEGFMEPAGQDKEIDNIKKYKKYYNNEILVLRSLIFLEYDNNYIFLKNNNKIKLIGSNVINNEDKFIISSIVDTNFLHLNELLNISKGDIIIKHHKFIGSIKDKKELRFVYHIVLDNSYDLSIDNKNIVIVNKNDIHKDIFTFSKDLNFIYDSYITK